MEADVNQITEKIIGCVYKVSNTLGGGFLQILLSLNSRQ